MLDGEAKDLRENEDVKEFYLGISGGDKKSFGDLNATAVGEMARLFLSPAPIAEPQGRRDDFWRVAHALFAAGFRAGDRVHNFFLIILRLQA